MHKYILDADNKPVVCDDVVEWGKWFEGADDQRGVAVTDFDGGKVSTVFLGMDHNFTHGEPVLWETMIFGGPHDGYCERYTSLAKAEAGHQRAVAVAGESSDAVIEIPPQTLGDC